MPSFLPFAGLRFARDRVRLDDVVCPPYDVISPDERAALEAHSQYNAVRVELPQDRNHGDRYERARHLFDSWRDEGILRRDGLAGFYGHRMLFTDGAGRKRTSTGVIGALTLEPPGGGILPHERTMPKPKGDRLDLLRATNINVSPIWGLSPAPGLTALIRPPERPLEHCTDPDGVTHQLWPITDPAQLEAIGAAVASAPVIVADGHHRFETALAYQAERRAASGDEAGDYDQVMALISELVDDELTVEGIHRLVSDLADGVDLVAALSASFDMVPTGPVDGTIGERMLDQGGLAVVTRDGTWIARPLPEAVARAEQPDLDSSILDVALEALGSHELTYQHGWDLAAAAVTKGEAQAAILIRPARVDQIAAIGAGGNRMPPKTTFFWPKPRTGLVFREVVG